MKRALHLRHRNDLSLGLRELGPGCGDVEVDPGCCEDELGPGGGEVVLCRDT